MRYRMADGEDENSIIGQLGPRFDVSYVGVRWRDLSKNLVYLRLVSGYRVVLAAYKVHWEVNLLPFLLSRERCLC
jgi:hypothetical protein